MMEIDLDNINNKGKEEEQKDRVEEGEHHKTTLQELIGKMNCL